jgi:acetylornithine deacetylase/succinyl-diaminopimelate desuccinylase-like protein
VTLPGDDGLSPVVRIARDLIRIDTSNYGGGRFEPESVAADYVETILSSYGISSTRYERAPGRTNLVARWAGTDPSLPALMLHGHLDVVPADAAAWTHGPFDGDIADGMLWGRGAVDVKNFVAMMLASVGRLHAEGFRPQRDIVLVFFADEEDGTEFGSDWMVDAHPEAFAGVTHAIGEGGGYSVTVDGKRAYLMNTGEKGVLWLDLEARGQAGHGSLPAVDNPTLTLAAAISRIGDIRWPLILSDTTSLLLERLRELAGAGADATPEELASVVGPSAPRIRAGLRDVSNVTIVKAGYKQNVVPEVAVATVDVRYIPGRRDEVLETVRAAAGDRVTVTEQIHLPAFESSVEDPLIDSLQEVITEVDPGAVILPHLIPGGTDAKSLLRIGITGYGFIPLKLPEDFAFPAMFHGVDERVPIESLEFGEDVIARLLRRS